MGIDKFWKRLRQVLIHPKSDDLTCQYAEKLDDVDEGLDAVAGGVHQDNEDEDGGNKEVAVLAPTRFGGGLGFVFNGPEDENVEDDEEYEGDKAEEN